MMRTRMMSWMIKHLWKFPMGLLVIGLLTGSCGSSNESEVGRIFKGQHPLRKLITSQSEAANYLLVTKGNEFHGMFVTFSWLMNHDNQYGITTVPIEKIRVRFDDRVDVPSVRYCWCAGVRYGRPLQEIVDGHILYVLIICRESHWNTEISLTIDPDLIEYEQMKLEEDE